MANKKAGLPVERTFTKAERARYREMTDRIRETQYKAEGLAKTIAGALYEIQVKKLYEVEDFKSIYEYGDAVHGISRGSVSEAINVFKAFGDPDHKDRLLPEWDSYAWRALTFMKSVPIEDLRKLEIDPTLPSATIKARIQDYKTALPELPDNGQWNSNTITAICEKKEADEEAVAQASKEAYAQAEEDHISSLDPMDSDYTPNESLRNTVRSIMGQEAYTKAISNESSEEDIDDMCREYVEEYMTFPTRTVKVTPGMTQTQFLDTMKALFKGIQSGEYNVTVTLDTAE